MFNVNPEFDRRIDNAAIKGGRVQDFFFSLIPLQIYAVSIFFLAYYLDSRNQGIIAAIDLRQEDRHWALQMLYLVIGMTAILFLMATLMTSGEETTARGAGNGSNVPMQIIFALLSTFYILGFVRHVAKNIAGKNSVFAVWVMPLVIGLALTAWWVFFPSWVSLNCAATIMMLYVLVIVRFANLYTAILILAAFALYDVINVFGTGLMIKAAMPAVGKAPLLVVVPESLSWSANRVSALGLGDIVLPGLAILAAFRESKTKKNPLLSVLVISAYLLALAAAFIAVRLTKSLQPALLYISPAVILALLVATPLWNAWKKQKALL